MAHVGTLNPDDRGATSYEGDALSVSVHPYDWEVIARLGDNPTWTLTRTDGAPLRFLDAHALTPDEKGTVMEWAASNGWARRRWAWHVPNLDDNGHIIGETMCDTREQAQQLREDAREMIVAVERDRLRIRHASHWETTEQHPVTRHALADPLDLTLTVWAAELPNVDGVWWDEVYAPQCLSCPRGALPTLDGLRVVRGWNPLD